MQKFLMALTTAVCFGFASPADASLILTGAMGFDVTNIQPSAGSLLNVSSFTFDLATNQTATNNFSPYIGNPAVSFGNVSLNLASPTPLTFSNAGFGTFAGTSFVQILNSSSDSIIQVTGTFTPGASSLLVTYDPVLVDFKISFNQGGNGTVGSAILFSPSGTRGELVNPEPASIAMFGTMLVPLAFGAFRRRQKAAQAAL